MKAKEYTTEFCEKASGDGFSDVGLDVGEPEATLWGFLWPTNYFLFTGSFA